MPYVDLAYLVNQKQLPSKEMVSKLAPDSQTKNKFPIICPACTVVILNESVAFCEAIGPGVEASLPKIGSKDESCLDSVDYYWKVNDMYNFENIGFTKPSAGSPSRMRYLLCAGCDTGALGYERVADKTTFCIASNRVRYEIQDLK